MNEAALSRNLKLYPWYQASAGFLPWLPVFFLFFFQYLSLSAALQLSAVYYLAVFLLEVPSGYFSDRFGRRLTLILSSCFAVTAYLLFIFAEQFIWLAAAQFLLAGYFSLKSGSDNALLFDTLKTLGRDEEYAQHEAIATRSSMLALAAAAITGGVTGIINLTIPYVLSLFGALASALICIQFYEPPQDKAAAPFIRQLQVCFKRLQNPQLLWLFLFFVFGYALQHVPAEFNQPYLKLLNITLFSDTDASALISGIMVAISMLAGAWGASISMPLMKRHGLENALIMGMALMAIIIFGMASVLHPAVIALVLLRNFPMAFCEPPLLAAIAPHIESHYRATYLSLQSLAGRLGFATLLFFLSRVVMSPNTEQLQWPEIQLAMFISAAIALVCVSILILLEKRNKDLSVKA